MFKRYVSFFIAFIFIIAMFPTMLAEKVYAYTNNAYFNNLKVGLVSMSAPSVTAKLNGDYTVNNQLYPSGTVLNLSISGTSISMNGSLQSQINITPNNQSNLLTITSGTVTNNYMGAFIIKVYNEKILPINLIDIENYLKGVVGYELSDSVPLEALKAQAVAARNYALSTIGYESANGYDFDDTPRYQTYKGFNPNYKNVIAAVDQTRGQVLLYNNTLVSAFYSAWHGGYSENSENVWGNYVPYLRSVQDPYENNPWPNGNITLTNAQIQSTLVTKGYLASTDTFINLDLNSITRFPSGRVSNINIIYKDVNGVTQTKSVTKDNTRTFLGFPSNMFTVTYDSTSGSYTFSGKGNGHGLGMSQIGAKNRAAAGQTYDQILKFYYQNVYLQNLILKATVTNLSLSSNSVFQGTAISFNTTAGAGNGYGYLYKYIIKNSGNVVFTKDYSSTASLDYVPTTPGSYTVEAYVKDSFSISDYDDIKSAEFTVYSSPILSGFSTSKTDVIVGQPVSANTNVTNGSGSYLYKYEVAQNGIVVQTRDFLTDKQFSYTPSEPGSYTMTVYVKDAASSQVYDLKQSQNFTAYTGLTLSSFTSDNQNVFVKDKVNFTAQAAGGSGKGINYKFVVMQNGQAVAAQDFSPSNTFAYVPETAGDYEVDVYAVDAASGQTYDASNSITFTVKNRAVITAFSADKNAAFVNDTFSFSASGNNIGSLYKYVISNNGTVVFTKDYSLNSTLQYTPAVSGNYQVQVFIKDSLSLSDYDDTQSLPFVVYDYPKLGTFTQDRTQLFKNDTINFNAAAVKGSGAYLYKFVVLNNGTAVSTQDFSTQSSFSFTPSVEGNYSVNVYVKDNLSQQSYDDMRTLSFVVLQEAKLISVQTNKTQYLIGQTMNINTTAAQGSGSYLYKYVITKDGINLSTMDYSNNSSLSYTFTDTGNYSVLVYVKDSLSSKDYDDMSTINIPVFSQPTVTYTSSQNSAVVGSAVKYSMNVSGGSGSFQFRFIITNGANTVVDTGYSDSSSYMFTPTAAGNYQIAGYMKDALTEKSYDYQSSLSLNAYNPQLSTVTAAGTFYEGKALTFTANSSGGSPSGVNYKFEVYKNDTLIASNSYNSFNTFTFIPASSGTYSIMVYGKDGASTNSYDTMKQFNIVISSKPLFLSLLPLYYGMTNNDVVSLQTALIKLGYLSYTATGYFGPLTKGAVISFQKANGLSADGIVGNITYGALNDVLISKQGSEILTY